VFDKSRIRRQRIPCQQIADFGACLSDDKFLEVALNGRADVIITGDAGWRSTRGGIPRYGPPRNF
jgi:predicted nucleic acid-binding protein